MYHQKADRLHNVVTQNTLQQWQKLLAQSKRKPKYPGILVLLCHMQIKSLLLKCQPATYLYINGMC